MLLKPLLSLPNTVVKKFAKGEQLIREGEIVDKLYYLTEGICDRIEYSVLGDEVLFNTKYSNQGIHSLIGVNLLWFPEQRSISTFVARTDITAYQIDCHLAKDYLETQPELLVAIMYMTQTNYVALRQVFKSRQERHSANAFCEYLLRNTICLDDDRCVVRKEMTNAEISRRLGIHQVTAAKIMTYLKNTGVLTREQGQIVIKDLTQLAAYAHGQKMPYSR